jgi:hypothetical protein
MESDPVALIADPRRMRFEKLSVQASQRSAQRQASRERIHARVVRPIDTPRLLRDPLERRESRVLSTLTSLRLLAGAVVVHGLIITCFALLNGLIGSQPAFGPGERLTVTIVEVPRPVVEPPPVAEVPAKEGPVEPEFAPPPVVEKPRPPLPQPVKPKTPPVPEVAAQEPVPRRIVGLSLESTVQGQGPAFATGTSRMARSGWRRCRSRSHATRGVAHPDARRAVRKTKADAGQRARLPRPAESPGHRGRRPAQRQHRCPRTGDERVDRPELGTSGLRSSRPTSRHGRTLLAGAARRPTCPLHSDLLVPISDRRLTSCMAHH